MSEGEDEIGISLEKERIHCSDCSLVSFVSELKLITEGFTQGLQACPRCGSFRWDYMWTDKANLQKE